MSQYTDLAFAGLKVMVSPVLPIYPSAGEDARRIVRHGLADVLAWLGEAVGPKPGAATHAYATRTELFVSREMHDEIANGRI